MSTSVDIPTYESDMVPTLFAPWARALIQPANPRLGERVLDYMLAVARAMAEREGRAVAWHEGSLARQALGAREDPVQRRHEPGTLGGAGGWVLDRIRRSQISQGPQVLALLERLAPFLVSPEQ
jgi:hypothetical protein